MKFKNIAILVLSATVAAAGITYFANRREHTPTFGNELYNEAKLTQERYRKLKAERKTLDDSTQPSELEKKITYKLLDDNLLEAEKEIKLVKQALIGFAECIEQGDDCAGEYLFEGDYPSIFGKQENEFLNHRDADFSSSKPWADHDHRMFKINPKYFDIYHVNGSRISYVAIVDSEVHAIAESCNDFELFGYGRSVKECNKLNNGYKETIIEVEYKLLKVDGKYFIDRWY